MPEPLRSLRPGAGAPSLDEQLRRAPQARTVVRLNPDEAGALFMRLAHLEAIKRRAEQVRDEGSPTDDPIERGAEAAARRILGEDG